MQSTRNFTHRLVLCALFAALIAVGAFIRIPVPFVPFTLQTFFVALAGMLLGRKLGAISVLVYICIGLIGLPVFTQGGGIGYVLQPTFGYLIGFIASAYTTGVLISNKPNPTISRLFLAGSIGLLITYAIGVPYFYLISTFYLGKTVAAKTLLINCFLITLPGDVTMLFVSSVISKRVLPILKRIR